MPRKKREARLWLRRRSGREPEWLIVDNGRQYATGCGLGDERRAQEALAKYLATRFRADTTQRDPGQIRIAEVLTLYMRDVAPSTASPALIAYHVTPLLDHFGRVSLAGINGQRCRDYWRDRGRAVSQSTVRRELTTLQAAINHWHRESPLPAVPAVVKPPESEARSDYLTRPEAAALLRAARRLRLPHIARFILIGLYTGTRHSAILSLRWLPSADAGHIDTERAAIHRRGSGEGETRKRRPVARVPERLMTHLRAWARADLAAGPQTAIVRWRGRPIVKERRGWESVVKAAGLEARGVTPHWLRHTCVTWALQSGMSEWDIAGLTGMSLKTLERVYGHHDPAFQAAAAGAFRHAG